MYAGVFEYHQWPLVTTFGKDPGVAHQLLVRDAGQHGDRERDLREGVEQFLVLNQRHAAVVQVLALVHAAAVHGPVDADHQIERQLELGAEFGERPEDEMRDGSRVCFWSAFRLQQ